MLPGALLTRRGGGLNKCFVFRFLSALARAVGRKRGKGRGRDWLWEGGPGLTSSTVPFITLTGSGAFVWLMAFGLSSNLMWAVCCRSLVGGTSPTETVAALATSVVFGQVVS